MVNNSKKYLKKIRDLSIGLYLIISIFEFYFNRTVGNYTRYFIFLIVLICLLDFWQRGGFHWINWSQAFLIMWTIYYMMSMLWSTNLYTAKTYLLTVISMTVLWFISYSWDFTEKTIDRFLFVYQLASLALCILGTVFSGAYRDDTTNNMRYVLYIGGVRSDPNYLLCLYIVCVQIGLFNLMFQKSGLIRKIIDAVSIIIGSYVILMTGSRSGIVLLAITFLLLFISKFNKINAVEKISFIIIILFLILLPWQGFQSLLSRYIPQGTLNRLFGIGKISFFNGTGRTETWSAALSRWKGPLNIIFGMGFGSNTTHSTILTFIMEFGIFGFLLFFIPNMILLVYLIKRRNILAIVFWISGMVQAFLCPATNMRFFWNAMIVPVIIRGLSIQGYETTKNSINIWETYNT